MIVTHDYIVHKKGEIVAKRLKLRGGWVVASIDQSIGWPQEDMIVEYEGRELVLMTYDDKRNLVPAVGILCQPGVAEKEARSIITSFLSALNWVSHGSLRVSGWTGGSHPFRSSDKSQTKYTAQFFRIHYLPTGLNGEQKLALALMREGDGLSYSHSGYSFLSYYKILNMVEKSGPAQKAWIKQSIRNLDQKANERIGEIQKSGEVVEDYLYHSCRCALAHAGVSPTVDPDDVEDSRRLSMDLPLIRSLAQYAIETEFGIKSGSKIYDEHLYELAGFKDLIDDHLLAEILAKDAVNRRRFSVPGQIAIRQWCDKRYGVFDNLRTKTKLIRDGVVLLECRSPDGIFAISLLLGFRDERFDLDVENALIDGEGGDKAIEYAIDHTEFLRDLIGNGEVEIFSADDGKFLGRKDANIPVNIDMGGTFELMNAKVEELRKRLDKSAGDSHGGARSEAAPEEP